MIWDVERLGDLYVTYDMAYHLFHRSFTTESSERSRGHMAMTTGWVFPYGHLPIVQLSGWGNVDLLGYVTDD